MSTLAMGRITQTNKVGSVGNVRSPTVGQPRGGPSAPSLPSAPCHGFLQMSQISPGQMDYGKILDLREAPSTQRAEGAGNGSRPFGKRSAHDERWPGAARACDEPLPTRR